MYKYAENYEYPNERTVQLLRTYKYIHLFDNHLQLFIQWKNKYKS